MPKTTVHTASTPTALRIYASIRQALQQTVIKNNPASFDVLVDSIRQNIELAQRTNDSNSFHAFLHLLKEPYWSAKATFASNSYDRIGYFYREGLTLAARWLLFYVLESYQTNAGDLDKKGAMARSVFSLFSDYVEANIQFGDNATLRYTYNEISQVLQDLSRRSADAGLRKNTGSELRYHLQDGWENYRDVASYFEMLQAAANYWTIFLYDEKKISLEELQQLQKILVLPNFSFDRYFPLAIKFREGLHPGPVRSWHDWDHEERLSGKVFSRPQPSGWAIWGFVVQLIKSEVGIYARSFENLDTGAVEFALDDILQQLETLKKEGFAQYHRYFELNDQIAFEKRIDPYIEQVKLLRKRSDEEKLRRIANLPMSPRIARQFTDRFVAGYREASDILNLFTPLGIVEKVSDRNALQTIGAKKRFWNSSKYHFIDDAEFSIPTFGMEQFGHQLADDFETRFLTLIQDGHSLHLTQDRVLGMREEIALLRKGKYMPSAILMGYDSWSSLLAFEPPAGYTPQETSEKKDGVKAVGYFEGLPVLRSRSPMLSGIIMVADVAAAFAIKLFVDPTSTYGDVTADIREISPEVANTIFEKNPDYWKQSSQQPFDDEKAKLFIRNGVYLDLYVLAEFVIKDPKAYRFISQGNPQ